MMCDGEMEISLVKVFFSGVEYGLKVRLRVKKGLINGLNFLGTVSEQSNNANPSLIYGLIIY